MSILLGSYKAKTAKAAFLDVVYYEACKLSDVGWPVVALENPRNPATTGALTDPSFPFVVEQEPPATPHPFQPGSAKSYLGFRV